MTAIRRITWLLVIGGMGLATPTPASAADLNKINDAIGKGAEFLKKMYAPNVTTPPGRHGLGSTALSGMAMLEAKVKPDDPVIVNIARQIRAGAATETKTYHVSLMILFLDRLGDKQDVPLIQMLGVRLYAGLTASGGWSYQCGVGGGGGMGEVGRAVPPPGGVGGIAPPQAAPVRPPKGRGQPNKPKKDDGFPRAKPKKDDGFPQDSPDGEDAGPAKLHPAAAQYYRSVRQAIRAGRLSTGTDNSNTQFGLIAMWVASRHGVPAEDAFALIEARFLTSQNPGDGGWSYQHGGGAGDRSTAAMTCAGLLGLAVGQARGGVGRPRSEAKTDPDDPFFNPKNEGKGIPDGGPKPIVAADRKRAIEAGLKAVGTVIRQTGAAGLPAPGAQGQGLESFIGLGNEYYLLWSIERVAMAYGLDSIGDTDWHEWGSNYLLPAQLSDGSWGGDRAEYGADVNTAFAILFLSRSNFVRDLSRKITGQVKDPGKAELRGTKDRPALFAPPEKQGSDGPGETQPATPPSEPVKPIPGLPPVQSPADPLADALVAATGADFDAKLKAARDGKGSEHTSALVHAIPKLDDVRQDQARQALADRLTRMTETTLRRMLTGPDVELRRGASLACAMKDDRQHIPDLIERITDPSDLVVRAARAGLKSLTEKDFGPLSGADEAAKTKAHAEWKKWYESQGKP